MGLAARVAHFGRPLGVRLHQRVGGGLAPLLVRRAGTGIALLGVPMVGGGGVEGSDGQLTVEGVDIHFEGCLRVSGVESGPQVAPVFLHVDDADEVHGNVVAFGEIAVHLDLEEVRVLHFVLHASCQLVIRQGSVLPVVDLAAHRDGLAAHRDVGVETALRDLSGRLVDVLLDDVVHRRAEHRRERSVRAADFLTQRLEVGALGWGDEGGDAEHRRPAVVMVAGDGAGERAGKTVEFFGYVFHGSMMVYSPSRSSTPTGFSSRSWT